MFVFGAVETEPGGDAAAGMDEGVRRLCRSPRFTRALSTLCESLSRLECDFYGHAVDSQRPGRQPSTADKDAKDVQVTTVVAPATTSTASSHKTTNALDPDAPVRCFLVRDKPLLRSWRSQGAVVFVFLFFCCSSFQFDLPSVLPCLEMIILVKC